MSLTYVLVKALLGTFMNIVSYQYFFITQATNLTLSRMHQITFSNSMTLLWILFAGECGNYAYVFVNVLKLIDDV